MVMLTVSVDADVVLETASGKDNLLVGMIEMKEYNVFISEQSGLDSPE